MKRWNLLIAATALLLFSVFVMGQQARPAKEPAEKNQPANPSQVSAEPAPRPPETPPPAQPQPQTQDVGAGIRWDMTEVPPVRTHHQITVKGKTLAYTATAGRLPIKDPSGKTEAQMFFVAYTLAGAEPARRPVTFAFNGGPGSASFWLHMGALGPRKVVLDTEGWMPAAPYRLQDNPYTPLDKTDLVLVDAIGTGFSRPADVETGRKFWGLRGDVEAFGEFIRMYITRNERWSSPLYLLGESYGTTRAAGVAGYLADRGINFNGIVLLSMVLNFQSLQTSSTNDVPYPLLLPTYTMIAAYHKKLAPDLLKDLDLTRRAASYFAMNQYWQALNKGDAITAQERNEILDRLAAFTGLPKLIIEAANLRVDVRTFMQWLLADQKMRVGRLDGRYANPSPSTFMEEGFMDPASDATQGPFTAVFNDYARRELNYRVDMPYYTSARESGIPFDWNWSAAAPGTPSRGFGTGFPDTATALRSAMIKNPYLKVLVMEGYYDLATPFLAAEYTIDHMNLTPELRKNISYQMYEAGHMMYVQDKSHEKVYRDLTGFIAATLPQN